MAKISIKFHPLFIIFSFILIYFGWFLHFFIYLIVLLLHEYSHYIVAKRLGYMLNSLSFMPYGAGLGGKNCAIKNSHEILISLAGPLCNIILVIISVCLWWCFPTIYYYTEIFVVSNLSLAIFNLLPIFPLDGGRVLVCLLSSKINKVKVYKIMKILGFIFSFVFAILFFISVFYEINLTLIFISIFLFLSCFGNDVNIYFDRTNIQNLKKEISSVMQVKSYVINSSTPVYKLLKYINSNTYSIFYLINNNKVVKVLTETEVLNLISE